MINKEQKQKLEEELESVSISEKGEAIINYRFGLGSNSNTHTTRETAEQFGMTHAGVIYHEKKVFEAMDLDRDKYVSRKVKS